MNKHQQFTKIWKQPVVIVSLLFILSLTFLLVQFSYLNFGQPTTIHIDASNRAWVFGFINLALIAFVGQLSWYFELRAYLFTAIIEQKKTKTQLKGLKHQLNPHFLFNSLNTVIQLVSKNKVATTYLLKMAKIYRYVLQQPKQKTTTLASELVFVEAYMYLQMERFKGKIFFSIDIDENILPQYGLVPLSLQRAMDFIIQRSILSIDKPLLIQLYIDDQKRLVVQYNRQQKMEISQRKDFFAEWKQQYKLLTRRTIEFKNTKQTKAILFPLLPNLERQYQRKQEVHSDAIIN